LQKKASSSGRGAQNTRFDNLTSGVWDIEQLAQLPTPPSQENWNWGYETQRRRRVDRHLVSAPMSDVPLGAA